MSFPFSCPMRTVADDENKILNQIMLTPRDGQKPDFLSRIGNIITDPIRNPCLIIFYGAMGEEGKTVLATNFSKVLGTSVVKWTVTNLIEKTSKWLEPEVAIKLAEKWLIVCDGCGIEEYMNYNNVKKWMSNAPVQSKGVSMFLPQTIIGISNNMGFATKSGVSNSVGRRVVICKMDKELGKLKSFPWRAVDDVKM